MAATETAARGKFLEGLVNIFHSSGPGRAEAVSKAEAESQRNFQESARDLHSAVEALRSKVELQKIALLKGSSETGFAPRFGDRSAASGPSRAEFQKQELERAVEDMRSSIIYLHSKLGTAITEDAIWDIHAYLEDLHKQTAGDELGARIRAAIVTHVFDQLGAAAWSGLIHSMKRVDIAWPEPGGLMPNPSDADRARATEAHLSDAEELFHRQNMKRGMDSMIGIESAWKTYPDRASWLWQEAALRGVASGIRCEMMREAVQKLRADGDELRAKANAALQEDLARVQASLESGLHSIEDAEKLISGTDAVVRTYLPELAWQHVREAVEAKTSELVKS